MVDLLQVAQLPPFLTERLEKEFTLHDFIAPDDLEQLLAAAGLQMGEPRGIAFSPTKGLHLSSDLALNYIVTARRA